MDGWLAQVLSTLAEKMKRDVDVGLLADFQRFRREKAANSGALAPAVKSGPRKVRGWRTIHSAEFFL
jgi:hypothetical protein